MTSSSNITDVKQGLRLRKVNSKYFSLKWRRGCRESDQHNINSHKNFNESIPDLSANKNGFFRNIKKKLSIKNLYKSKRKIINSDSTNCLGAGGSNLMANSNDTPVSSNDDRNIVEIRDRIGAINLNLANNSHDLTRNSRRNRSNDNYSSSDYYLNVQSNINNSEQDSNDLYEDCQDRRVNESNKSNSPMKNHVNNVENRDNVDKEQEHENNNEKKCMTNLSQELQKLRKYGWYWGNTSGEIADAALLSEPDGAFLIRDSSDRRHLLTLSFKSAGKLLHARVEHSGGMFSLCNQGESGRFPSVPELIDHSMNFSKSAVFCYSRPRHPGYPAFPVRLTKPISRFNRVRSLQYLCRFVIRQNTRWDNIHKLPLPKSLRIYIEEGHY
ncbi:hypothetical protein PV325_006655 [Microctonus aethiopoides]|uniref:Suppressor of cytokine signaling 6 n=1 Tax=Microctonus aethiopoides TaxID=144406 RepID=A0AA39KTN6_9HYME|nr:hypothetical protein PV326_012433 [Microctonus aethiopoides]KAK0084639.1 hypothetical protein PV325_006655 [Microctonus aethiopoides]KAK0173322.1 hypothetical protein PV328_006537 [Microctonus aethiopoides]